MVDVLPDDHVETRVLRRWAPSANCLVVGAYKGATMRYLLECGARHVIGVEPQQWAYDRAVESLVGHGPASWELLRYALVPWETGRQPTVIDKLGTDAARLLMPNEQPASSNWSVVDSMCISEFMKYLAEEGAAIDFCVMNIEGAEYMLLGAVCAEVPRVLVQFHGPPMPVDVLPVVTERTEIGRGWFLYS